MGNQTINPHPVPNVTSITKTDETCGQSNGSITFNFTDEPTRNNVKFSLDGGLTYQSQVADNSGSTTYNNLASGTYDLWVSWGNNACPIDLSDITITNQANLIVDAGNNQSYCLGEGYTSTAISASGSGGILPYSYAWNNGLGSGQNKTISNLTTSTTYTVTITDANGCTATDQIQITINDFPNIQFTITHPSCGISDGEIVFCFPNHPTRTAIEVSFDGGNTYQSSFADNIGTKAYSNRSAGIFPIYARWGNDECPIFLGTAILENNQNVKAAIAAADYVCIGNSTTLNAIGVNGVTPFSFSWLNGVRNTATVNVNPTTTTTYTVQVVDGNGCVAYEKTTIIADPCGEICNNGIDDDGDNLVDCDDHECKPSNISSIQND